jgi:succinyl-CoA synthetase alpha subunit
MASFNTPMNVGMNNTNQDNKVNSDNMSNSNNKTFSDNIGIAGSNSGQIGGTNNGINNSGKIGVVGASGTGSKVGGGISTGALNF